MASEVELCNLALSNIRAGSINSLTEASLAAQQCKLKYPIMRDRCLADKVWGFNRKLVALSPLFDTVFGWGHLYQYPVDCLKIGRLIGEHEELSSADAGMRSLIAYELFNVGNNRTIASNTVNLRMSYSAKVVDPNLFSDDFVVALSHLLASELAIPLVGGEVGRQLRSDSLQLYTRYIDEATANDLNAQHIEPAESEFVTCRE